MITLPESLVSDQPAALVENAGGKSDVVLICEHAGRQLPEFIGSLGVDEETMSSHIAWDLGAEELSRLLSELLDAPLIMQRYSRLVYDCNRCFDAVDTIVEKSDEVFIPVGDSQLEVDDKVVLFAIPSAIREVEKFFY